jgi:GTP-binding protein HflX
MDSLPETTTRAWVLLPDIKTKLRHRSTKYSLVEAVSLANALPNLTVVGDLVVYFRSVHPGTFFGKGKISELEAIFKSSNVELVLIDGHISPVQQRNLEKKWDVKILDRTGLILEIFSDRARTREGVLQVEMAALSYQKTRLVRAWTHLERQRGGLGFVGGPGETQIESDRRAIDTQLTQLKRQLAKVVKTRKLHRSARAKVPYPIVALVGYTNAGKSTLFNYIAGADVLAEDMLFATLDPTMRAVQLSCGIDVIMSDTVGFITNLPTELVASFRATLEEVIAADLVVHVRDISHPETAEQAKDVEVVLETLGLGSDVPRMEIWNKTDLLASGAFESFVNACNRLSNVYMMSSTSGEGVQDFLDGISGHLSADKISDTITLNFSEGKKRGWLFNQRVVQSENQTETGYAIKVNWSLRQKKSFIDL